MNRVRDALIESGFFALPVPPKKPKYGWRERKPKLEEMYRAGIYTAREAAAEVGVSKARVYNVTHYFRRAGIPGAWKGAVYAESRAQTYAETHTRIRDLLAQGVDIKTLRQKSGVSVPTLYRHLHALQAETLKQLKEQP